MAKKKKNNIENNDMKIAFACLLFHIHNRTERAEELLEYIQDPNITVHVCSAIYKDEINQLGRLSIKEMEEPLTEEEEKTLKELEYKTQLYDFYFNLVNVTGDKLYDTSPDRIWDLLVFPHWKKNQEVEIKNKKRKNTGE